MYVLSGTVVLGWVGSSRRANRQAALPTAHARTRWLRTSEERMDGLLGVALLLCAVLPQSHVSEPALIWRAVIAVLLLYRLVTIGMPLLVKTGLRAC
jgi:voltage-gated potassium channel